MTRLSRLLRILGAPVLFVISAAHMALFVGFTISLMTVDPASTLAEETPPPTCTGTDLFARLQQDDPSAADAAEATAASQPNGSGLLWRIEGPEGASPSWLYGTMHSTDPRILDLPDAVRERFEASDTYVMETTDARSPMASTLAMATNPSLFFYTDGGSALDGLTAEDRAALADALSRRGNEIATVARMKPWLVAGLLAAPPCELARKTAGLEFLDNALATEAEADGKTVAGLETLVEQIETLAALPMEDHRRAIAAAAALDAHSEDVFETMVAIYTSGETALFIPALEAVSETLAGPADEADAQAAAAFERTVVTARNHRLAEGAAAYLDEGGAFIAIGALHLPGEEGIVALLREAGYNVTPVAL